MFKLSMFCNQCEQTAKGVGYTTHGVYGKDPAVAALQHLLLPALMGLSIYANEAHKKGTTDETVNRFTAKAIFSTLTNVDFDPAKFQQRIAETVLLRQQLKAKIGNPAFEHPAANFAPATDIPGLVVQGKKVGLLSDEETDADIRSLQ
ncbi:MAG: Hydroxylamine reductase [Syntrophomonadaceae bacterium]|nr:Hydroxylamine reductase [Bacillota bacterium]